MARAGYPAVLLLALAACSDGSAPPPAAGNQAPQFTSAATTSAPENSAGTVYTATASDADGDTVTFSISGGADSARFAIVAATGALSFVSPPDFENPADANADNIYEATLAASDGRGGAASLALRVTVTNVAEPFVVRRKGAGFNAPLFVAGAGDGSGRLFVVEKGGLIRIFNPSTGAINATPFLDVTGEVSTTGERGLLGLAFAPDYPASGRFYIQMSEAAGGTTEVRRYLVSANPNVADAASGDVILRIPHTATNHRSGFIGFGPDGFLYVSAGDNGVGANTSNPAQDVNSLFGKMLRIDVSGDDFPADPDRDYRIPSSNPFAAGGGRAEIYAIGLRNSFRASFDPPTGRLYIGDVGEGAREEIDLIPPGQAGMNFGWVRFEGTQLLVAAVSAPGAVPPVAEYTHGSGPFQGNSVTGGVVYRGPVAALQGQYVFGDFVSENIWTIPAASLVNGTTIATSGFTRRTAEFLPDVGTIDQIACFGTDDSGNLYVVDLGGEIFRLENP